ncbi:glycosyltransferase [Aureivirga sp. CE67]|uniref:glycosyltransferase n=1 Tax=Aureivirga sp. CE67 TaxID=1788983 RepID=UPI0018CB969F|nr:glycosyltransferase [Aureivirga sp. CE67]
MTYKKILIAPLNWGLGHASRCVPIINQLLKNNFEPIIASDGNALKLLQKEFPNLKSYKLPSYNITYSKNSFFFNLHLLLKAPHIWKAVQQEKKLVEEIIQKENIQGIISDNRFGVCHSSTPSVYITHQTTVFSGITTPITTFFHQNIIKKFNECWIPDDEKTRISGKLSFSYRNLNQKFIGTLSRFQKQDIPTQNDILIILSGPEPQRTYLEEILKEKFQNTKKQVLMIRGIITKENQTTQILSNFKIKDFLLTKELEKELNHSNLIICRAGYSSIMDLYKLNKNAILIPTPNQKEQEYLATYLQKKDLFTSIKQSKLKDFDFENFKVEKEQKLQKITSKIDFSIFR